MLRPIQISFEDFAKLIDSEDAAVTYYQAGTKFQTTKEKLLKSNITKADKAVIAQFPNNIPIKMKNIEIGVFTFDY